MQTLSNYLRLSHCRDILVTYVRSIRSGTDLFYKYEIPLYDDKPYGVPIIEIQENKLIVTFTNQEKPRTTPRQ